METIVVKIENTYVAFAHVKKSGDSFRVLFLKKAALPESLIGEEAGKNPDLVANFLVSELQSGEFPVKNLSVHLGGGTELFTEYRYSDALPDPARKQRRQQSEEALLAAAAAPLYRVKHYSYDGTDSGISASAVLAADTFFCDRLGTVLTKAGFTVTIIASSLTAFAETAKTVSGLGERVIVLCAEKKEMQAALLIEGRLARLARIAKGTDAQDPVTPLMPYITDETRVVLCGEGANDPRFTSRLKRSGALDVVSVDPDMTSSADRIELSDEIAHQSGLFPEAFAAAALAGEEGEPVYFSETRDVKRAGAGLRAACIVALLVAVFACVLPPATLTVAERETEANRSRLETPFYADAAAKLEQYRSLVSEYSELLEAEAALPGRDPSHADILDEVVSSLLANTQILELYYEKGKGILADFTTKDAETFDKLKDAASRNKEIFLYESKLREEIDEDEWHIQIRVTLVPSAREAP